MQEQRAKSRARSLHGGSICFNHSAAIDCVVKNCSDTGACLEVASPIGIPESFVLTLNKDQTTKPCRVIWRTSRRLGVTFELA
jgi:hypothetical protein